MGDYPELDRRPYPRGHKQTSSENNNENVRNLQSPTEYRPEFGSLIASLVSLFGGFLLCIAARRFGGALDWFCLSLGLLLIVQSTVGLLFGLDWWSLGRRFRDRLRTYMMGGCEVRGIGAGGGNRV
jgi:hypothetical protein